MGRHPATVSLRYRSYHGPDACPNIPQNASVFTSVRSKMEFAKYFKKEADRSYRCTIPVKIKDDDDKEKERGCNEIVSVNKDSMWNLKTPLSQTRWCAT